MNENTNLVKLTNDTFRLPDTMDGAEFTRDDLAEDMDGLQFTFTRMKIPSGGALQFELPGGDPEKPDYAYTVEGVIVHNHSSYALWAEGSENEEDALPLCSSVDGKIGMGEPGGDCISCSANKFGTGANGKGKLCKNMRVLYLLRDGECLPIQITLPPTSIRPFSDFYKETFALRSRAAFGSIVSIGLKRMNNGKDDYSVATFKKVADFTGEKLVQAKAYSEGFKKQIKLINQNRAAEAASRGDDLEEINYASVPGAHIDGDRVDDLPA
jgi:hypothetical protein